MLADEARDADGVELSPVDGDGDGDGERDFDCDCDGDGETDGDGDDHAVAVALPTKRIGETDGVTEMVSDGSDGGDGDGVSDDGQTPMTRTRPLAPSETKIFPLAETARPLIYVPNCAFVPTPSALPETSPARVEIAPVDADATKTNGEYLPTYANVETYTKSPGPTAT